MTLGFSGAPVGALPDFGAPAWLWVVFAGVVTALLFIDLFVVNAKPHTPSHREAAITSIAWVSIGIGFGALVWATLGGTAASQYLASYTVEKTLSVDNVFVWAVIFSSFAVESRHQHRLLFWGVIGAIALRAAFIFSGVALLERLDWVLYVFGALLLITALRVARPGHASYDPQRSRVLAAMRTILPMSDEPHDGRLFTRQSGKLVATPLFAVLVVIEATDVVFAVDSVPAVLAISHDPFVVLSSNTFAILGLRSLYFLLGGTREALVHLDKGLAAILAFVGMKMMLSRWIHISALASIGVIALVLVVVVVTSARTRRSSKPVSDQERLPERRR